MSNGSSAERTERRATVGATARRALPSFPLAGARMRAVEAIRRWLDGASRDLADGAAPPLLAVVFAVGIALYFRVPREPWLPALLVAAIAVATIAVLRRRAGARALGTVTAAVLLAGAATAAISTARVAAPRLDRERTVGVVGRVIDLDGTAKGGTRLGVAVARMEATGLAAADTPTTISATVSARGGAPAIGDAIAFKARLKPPEGPVLPGGYDFARRAWFDGRGASGYVLGRTHPADLGPLPLAARLLAPIGDLRHTVAERVRASLPGGTGAIGAALMVGEQRAIPESVAEPLRASGLTHIVSISGLHMSLVAGGVMAVLRLLFVAMPGVSLHHAAKKWAAVAAFAAATFYLLMSGMQVAALRSHLMVSIALLAVLVDRPAITMHTVAVAAAAILIVDPASALEPSFQMSFLAVIALVASWDLWRLRVEARPPPRDDTGPLAQTAMSAWHHIEGLAFSSLIAGLATAPVIAAVFYRGAPYSIIANMIVLPVVGTVVMPAAVVAALAMPFGLDAWPLAAMGLGIDVMVAVGRWASALPGGSGLVGAPHPAMMPLGVASVLWLSLWRSRIRLLGIVPGVVAMALLAVGPRPDVLVGRHGSPVAVRGDDGRLHLLMDKNDRFDAAIWLAADADDRLPGDPTLASGWRCDRFGCVFRRGAAGGADTGGLVVAVVRDPRGFGEDCDRADVVISRLAAPPGCAATATVIDRPRQAATGALALTLGAAASPDPDLPIRPDRTSVDPTDAAAWEDAGDPAGADVRPGPIEVSDAIAGKPPSSDEARRERPPRNRAQGPSPGTAARDLATSPDAGTAAPGSGLGVGSEGATPSPPAGRTQPKPSSETPNETPSGERPSTDEPQPDPTRVERSVTIDGSRRAGRRFDMTVSLPAPGRPWTPRDPFAERSAREVTPEVRADPAGSPAFEDRDPTEDLDQGERQTRDDQPSRPEPSPGRAAPSPPSPQ